MKLINTSKRERGIPGAELVVLPSGGEMDITEAQLQELLGYPMVASWLHQGNLTVKDGKAEPDKVPKTETREGPELPEGITGDGVEFHQNGGWYRVYVNGIEVTDSNVRKAQAEEIAAEYG